MSDRFDVLVVGEGVAGLTVAGLLAERGKQVAIFESNMFGGLILNLNHLDPIPSGAPTSGSEYVSNLVERNMALGVTRLSEEVTSFAEDDGHHVAMGSSICARAPYVVLASGARWRPLGVPGEAQFEGKGVSHCADCDGRLFLNREVVVAGSGDSALQEALVLSAFCKTVHLVARGSAFTAQDNFVDAIRHKHNVNISFETEVLALLGTEQLEGVVVRTPDGEARPILCSCLFPFVGLIPNTEYLSGLVKLDAEGRARTNADCATSLPGVWAIGAVRSGADGLLTGVVTDAHIVAHAIP